MKMKKGYYLVSYTAATTTGQQWSWVVVKLLKQTPDEFLAWFQKEYGKDVAIIAVSKLA